MPKRFKFKETQARAHARWGDLKMGKTGGGKLDRVEHHRGTCELIFCL
jgi:hypothetical protein